jgi:Flp pilus assembly protein TadG
MKLKQIRDDTRGNALVEFTVTISFFLLLIFGLVQAGFLLYTYNGLQHGVEMAARCASVNYAANQIGLNTSCFTDPNTGSPTPSTVIGDKTTFTTIKQYAAQNSWEAGGNDTFTVNPPPTIPGGTGTGQCGTNSSGTAIPGYEVSVSHFSDLIHYIFRVTLTAKSCFPI